MACGSTPATRLGAAARTRACAECGDAYTSGRSHAEFCSTACRKAWNNRRAVRGAELYDLLMALRFDRKTATRLKVWKMVCRLVSMFRDEDVRERAARRSWRPTREILGRRPYLAATVMGRNVGGGRRHSNG